MRRALLSTLAILLLAPAAGCRDTPPTIDAPPPGYRQDLFPQDAASRIDVLWVIDNSASMQPHQEALATSLDRFMNLFSRGAVDYRIAVKTTDVFTDQGDFLGNPAIITPDTTDPIGSFQRNVQVGIQGKGHEEAFEAARLAITREQQRSAGVLAQRDQCIAACPSSGGAAQKCQDDCRSRNSPAFMRPEAHLFIVFVSDEDEQSFGEVRYYQRLLEGALGKGNEGAVSVATICGDVPTPPCVAQPGVRYAALAAATGGITASICDADFDAALEKLALNAVGLKHKFVLSEVPLLDTMTVQVKYRCDTDAADLQACSSLATDCAGKGIDFAGKVCVPAQSNTNGWTWEDASNALIFHGTAVPALRSTVVVSYQAANGS